MTGSNGENAAQIAQQDRSAARVMGMAIASPAGQRATAKWGGFVFGLFLFAMGYVLGNEGSDGMWRDIAMVEIGKNRAVTMQNRCIEWVGQERAGGPAAPVWCRVVDGVLRVAPAYVPVIVIPAD